MNKDPLSNLFDSSHKHPLYDPTFAFKSVPTVQKILKYRINLDGKNSFPEGCQFLCVQIQDSVPHIWVLADPIKPLIERVVNVYMTGQEILNEPGHYLGTVQCNGFVAHVFIQD